MVVVAILAAGRGTRMKSHLPKVLHSLGGRSLVERVLESVQPMKPSRRMLIVGYQALEVKTAMQSNSDLEFVEQAVQLGTGHAIQQLLPHLEGYT
ncbi:MAG: NTP transferase domain-containing protein, partial [Tolypothrix sp. Co-bin9]|nr:NTP transferase domain-containing protein [Tolypothrix sp. Co-bin9]